MRGSSAAWAFAGQGLNVGVLFTGSVILARLLTPAEMGIYALAAAILGLFTALTTSGISSYIVREFSLNSQQLSTAFTLNAIANLILTAALLLASLLPLFPARGDAVPQVLRLLAIVPLINALEFRPSAMLYRAMEFHKSAVVIVTSSLINVGVTITLAVAGFSYLSIPCGIIAGALWSALAYSLVGRDHVSFSLSLVGWRPIAMFGGQMLSISGVAVFTARMSDVVLGATLGLAALGVYSRATSLANLIFFNIYGTATRVAFAQLSRAERTTGSITPTYLLALDSILGLMWPLLVGVAILSGPIIHTIFGPQWTGAALPLSILMLAQVVILTYSMNLELFVLRRRTAEQTKYEVMRGIGGFGLFSAGATISMAAAALGRVGEALIGAMLYLPKMASLSGASPAAFRRIYARSVRLAALACLPAAFLMMRSEATPSLLHSAIAVIVGVLLWLAGLLIMKHPLLVYARRLVLM